MMSVEQRIKRHRTVLSVIAILLFCTFMQIKTYSEELFSGNFQEPIVQDNTTPDRTITEEEVGLTSDVFSGGAVSEAEIWFVGAADPIVGKCDNYIIWSFSQGVLTLSSDPSMTDYDDYNMSEVGVMSDYEAFSISPFYRYRNQIKKIVFNEGIKRVGENIFQAVHMNHN